MKKTKIIKIIAITTGGALTLIGAFLIGRLYENKKHSRIQSKYDGDIVINPDGEIYLVLDKALDRTKKEVTFSVINSKNNGDNKA